MPRTGRGGRRVGTPGTAYANRTDLNAQPIRTAPSKTYGDGVRQTEQQRAMPLAAAPATVPAPALPPSGPAPELGGLYAPSMRADEPVQAGLSIGPGEGPMGGAQARDILVALAKRFPYLDDLRREIDRTP